MLDPNVAQSPVLAVAAANSASPADAGSAVGPGGGSADGDAALPFAAVLQRQLAQPDDAKAAQTIEALIDVKIDASAGDKSDAAAADAQAAVLAWLAPLLAGAVPASPAAAATTAEHADGEALVVSADSAAMPIAIAAPAQAVAAIPGLSETLSAPSAEATALPTSVAEATGLQTPAGTADLQTPAAQAAGSQNSATDSAADFSSQSSAILAGAKTMAAESSAPSGNGGTAPQAGAVQSFDSLLNAASAAAAAHARPQTTAAANPASVTPITTPVGAQGWENEIGGKLTWMVGRQETRAELVLNPPQMGRIEVSLSMNGNQANALFVSANPAVREALENAMPHLREILQDAGISLGQAHVGAESFRQSAHDRENGDNPLRGKDRDAVTMTNALSGGTVGLAPRRGNSLVDTFA